MDPWLGARVTGAELSTMVTGAELLGMGKWPARGLGARVTGADLCAVDLGAELGARVNGTEPPGL